MKQLLSILTTLLLLSLILILIPNTIAINQTININLNITPQDNCSIEISIITNKEFYNPGEQISYYNNLTTKPQQFEIKYYIIDINNNTIKQPTITKNLDEKHFTPKQTREDRLLIIKNELLSVSCSNTNPIKTSEKTILIQGNSSLPEEKVSNKTKTTVTKTNTNKTTAIKTNTNKTAEKTKQTAIPKTYTITQIPSTESLLNTNLKGNYTEIPLYISGQEKARSYAKYMLLAAIILFIIGIKWHSR